VRGAVLVLILTLAACERGPAEVGDRVLVTHQHWNARGCGTPFPYVVSIETEHNGRATSQPTYVLHCPAFGTSHAWLVSTPSLLDRFVARMAWRFGGFRSS
jgi:hypothetical protein